MAIDPAAISAMPAITTIEVFEMLPDSPAASANGTVNPSAMPMITSRTNNPEVKWVSTSGGRCGCGCSSFTGKKSTTELRNSNFVRLHPLDRFGRDLALALVAQFFRSFVQREPHRMCDFVPHLFFDVADLAAQVAEQVEADDFEDLRAVAPRPVVNVLDIRKLRDGLGFDAGFFMDLAKSGLLRLFAFINVAFGQSNGWIGLRLLLPLFAVTSARLDSRDVPFAPQPAQHDCPGGKFSLHALSRRSQ